MQSPMNHASVVYWPAGMNHVWTGATLPAGPSILFYATGRRGWLNKG
jgi:hypothetical protein